MNKHCTPLSTSLTITSNSPAESHIIRDNSFQIANLATRAILYEVSCFPSPGLVSPTSTGAHNDMDYYTFLDSSTTLMKYLTLFAEAGFSDNKPCEIFSTIRKIGIEAEQAMFATTNGVNTHKGMLFLMGIACTATAQAIYHQVDFSRINDMIKNMTSGIVRKDLQKLTIDNATSHGEKLFLTNGITGVRGEVEAGMPTVFSMGLPFYKANCDLPENSRLLQTLFKIMSVCDDTTIIHRHSITMLQSVKTQAKNLIELGGVRNNAGKKIIDELCETFMKKNISPGGSADLLAVTVFFYLVEEYFYENGKYSER